MSLDGCDAPPPATAFSTLYTLRRMPQPTSASRRAVPARCLGPPARRAPACSRSFTHHGKLVLGGKLDAVASGSLSRVSSPNSSPSWIPPKTLAASSAVAEAATAVALSDPANWSRAGGCGRLETSRAGNRPIELAKTNDRIGTQGELLFYRIGTWSRSRVMRARPAATNSCCLAAATAASARAASSSRCSRATSPCSDAHLAFR